MNNPAATPIASPFVIAILQALISAIPEIATWIAKGIVDDSSPLADQVRALLPEDGASAAARRLLEGGASQ